RLLRSDIHDWRITFVATGLDACVGERLMAVRPFLGDDERFLANYADGVTDAPLDAMIAFAERQGKAATFLGVRPTDPRHVTQHADDGSVTRVQHVTEVGLRRNGGFVGLHRRVFDYMRPREELAHEPVQRMIAAGDLATYAYDGFWACM